MDLNLKERVQARVLLPVLAIASIGFASLRHSLTLEHSHGQVNNYSGNTMGSTFSVTWRESEVHTGVRPAVDAVFLRVNQLMSTYDPTSELSRFNQFRGLTWFAVAPETAQVIALAREISVWSDGAFDVTVKPLVAAWGFGAGAQATPPTEEQLAILSERVGYDKLQIRQEPPGLRKSNPELEVDLSAIAPGYAADLIAQALEKDQIHDYLIDVGGELRIAGHKTDGVAWRIAIEEPDTPDRTAEGVYEPGTTSLATSGDYRKFYLRNGKRFSHTIDPRIRRPIEHNLASITVLSPSCARADGLATALNVLGPEAGLVLAERTGLSVLMLVRNADGSFKRRVTGWFANANH